MNKKLAEILLGLGLTVATAGTLSAQEVEAQKIQNMDELKTYLEIQDGDENSFAYTIYMDQLHRDVLGASYNPETAFELSTDVLNGVNRLITQGKKIPKYGISELDTTDEFYNLLIGSHIPAQAIPVIKEIQSRIGVEQTGRLFTDENFYDFMKEAYSIYQTNLSRVDPLVQSAQDTKTIKDLKDQLKAKELELSQAITNYKSDVAGANLARVSTGHFPELEVELYSAIAKEIQQQKKDGELDTTAANAQIGTITDALYNHLIDDEITHAQQYLSEDKLQDALYAITNANLTFEGARDVQQILALKLDPVKYDTEGQAKYETKISDLQSQITLAIESEKQISPEDLLKTQAIQAFSLEQKIRNHNKIPRKKRADDWKDVLEQYEATQDAIYNSYVTVLLNDVKMSANKGDINAANTLLEKATENYNILLDAQPKMHDIQDKDLLAMQKDLDNAAKYVTMTEDKTLNRLQGNELSFLIKIPFGINSIITKADDGSTYDLTSTETTFEVGLGAGLNYTHRVDNLIIGLDAYVEGIYGWRERSWSESVSGDSGSDPFLSTFATNYNLSINGQVDTFLGERVGANEDQTKYFAEIFGILSFKDKADIGHIESDNIDYSNNMWAIGPGVGTKLHFVNNEKVAFDGNVNVQYYLLNFSDTAYKGHEIHGKLGLDFVGKNPAEIAGLNIYGDYALNISQDKEVYHTINLGGAINIGEHFSVYGEGNVLNTKSTTLSNGSIEPGIDASFGVEFKF